MFVSIKYTARRRKWTKLLHLSVSVQCMFHPVNGFGEGVPGGNSNAIYMYIV